MSYVIQNYNNINRRIVTTPRFKAIWLFYNIDKIIIFFKIQMFTSFSWNQMFDINSFYFIFQYFFFSKQIFKYINTLNFKYVGPYDTKLIRSSTILFYKTFYNNIGCDWKVYPLNLIDYSNDKYLYNAYILPVKIMTVGVSKFFFKNIFFYHMLSWGFLWYQRSYQFKFYLNFILATPSLNLFKFYSNYFLKTYNY